jgi:tetratricopeptide (TPR) repeat protein
MEAILLLRLPNLPSYKRWTGYLTLFVAVFVFVLSITLRRGTLVNSPEFGILMAEGRLAQFGLSLLEGCSVLAAGVAWHVARLASGKTSRLRWIFLFGGIVAISTAVRIILLPALNQEDSEPFQVRYFDLWWPPALAWLAVCLIGIVMAILPVGDRLGRLGLYLLFVAFLTVQVLHRPEFADWISGAVWGERYSHSWTRVLWEWAFILELFVGTGLVAFVMLRFLTKGRSIKWRWLSLPLLGVAVLLLSAGIRVAYLDSTQLLYGVTGSWQFWTLWLVLSGISMTTRSRLPLHEIGSRVFNLSTFRLVTMCGLFGLSLVYLFYFQAEDIVVPLASFALGWILLVEITAGSCSVFSLILRKEEACGDVAARGKKLAYSLFLGTPQRALSRFKGLLTIDTWLKATVKTLVGLLILVAISEIPNIGKTIIQPFSGLHREKGKESGTVPSEHPQDATGKLIIQASTGDEKGKDKEFGSLVSDHLFDAIGSMKESLRTDVTLSKGGGKGVTLADTVSGEVASDLNAVLGKSSDMEIGGVKIPLSLLAGPIQGPLRWVLGVRVITGSYHEDESGYALLARSSTGEILNAQLSKFELGVLLAEKKLPNQHEGTLIDALDFMTQRLAFGIVSIDARLNEAGMTRDWEAFRQYQKGLMASRQFDLRKDYRALIESIDYYRRATQQDPRFALAHYRLGLALRGDGQPASSIAAFRESLKVKPDFGACHLALALTLYNFKAYKEIRTAAASVPDELSIDASTSQIEEARKLFLRVTGHSGVTISTPDRALASSYLALLNMPVTGFTDGYYKESQKQAGYLAYFYGRRAERLLSGMPQAQRATQAVREREAQAQVILGHMLMRWPGSSQPVPVTEWQWQCSMPAVQEGALPRSPFTSAASRYYDRATKLLPDNPDYACRAATAAYVLGDEKRMAGLDRTASAHLYLAQSSLDAARERRTVYYYILALREFEKAIELEPGSVEALNEYAYTFWRWRVNGPDKKPPVGPDFEIAMKAERYARRAVEITRGKLDPVKEAQVRSTLGEVLLGQARTEEAAEVLREALQLAPDHPFFDEMRWDMAQACLLEHTSKGSTRLFREAIEQMKTIRGHDETREDKLFPLSGARDKLDPLLPHPACRHDEQYSIQARPAEDSSGAVYELAERKYSRYRQCDWFGVVVEVDSIGEEFHPEGATEGKLRLHVWGGGVDQHVEVKKMAGIKKESTWVFLGYEPRTTDHYYHAQLEQELGGGLRKAVSKAYPIPTFANEAPGACSRNLIYVRFKRASIGSAQGKESVKTQR